MAKRIATMAERLDEDGYDMRERGFQLGESVVIVSADELAAMDVVVRHAREIMAKAGRACAVLSCDVCQMFDALDKLADK